MKRLALVLGFLTLFGTAHAAEQSVIIEAPDGYVIDNFSVTFTNDEDVVPVEDPADPIDPVVPDDDVVVTDPVDPEDITGYYPNLDQVPAYRAVPYPNNNEVGFVVEHWKGFSETSVAPRAIAIPEGVTEHRDIGQPDRANWFENRVGRLEVKSPTIIVGIGDATLKSSAPEGGLATIKLRPGYDRVLELYGTGPELFKVLGRPGADKSPVTADPGSSVFFQNVMFASEEDGGAENGLFLAAPDTVILDNVFIDGNRLQPRAGWDHCIYFTSGYLDGVYLRPRNVQLYNGAMYTCPVHALKSRGEKNYVYGTYLYGSGNGAVADFMNAGQVYMENVHFMLMNVGTHSDVQIRPDSDIISDITVVEQAPGKGPDKRVIQFGQVGLDLNDPSSLTLVNVVVDFPNDITPQFRNDVSDVEAVIKGQDTIIPDNSTFIGVGTWRCVDVPRRDQSCNLTQ